MDCELLMRILGVLGNGVVVTITVTIGALLLAVILGFALAALSLFWPAKSIGILVAAYVELLRNVPSLTVLFILYYGLAPLGIRLPPIAAAIIGLGLIGAAVSVDIFKAGFKAVPAGQAEAAAAVGLSPGQAFALVILPQSLRLSLAPLANYAVALVKDTSLVAAIAAPEIMFNARQIVNETFQTGLVYGCAAGLYLILTFILGQAVRSVEKRLEY